MLAAQGGICAVVYDTLVQVICDQVQTMALGETIDEHVHKYFGAGKAAEPMGRKMVNNEDLLTPIPSFGQKRTIDAVADQQKADILRTTSMAHSTNIEAAVTAEACFVLH